MNLAAQPHLAAMLARDQKLKAERAHIPPVSVQASEPEPPAAPPIEADRPVRSAPCKPCDRKSWDYYYDRL